MRDSIDRTAYANRLLMAANVIFFLYLEIAGSSEDAFFMYAKGAMLAPAVLEGKEYYRLVTAMFMHFGIGHLVNNMLVLFVMGEPLEQALGQAATQGASGQCIQAMEMWMNFWHPGSRLSQSNTVRKGRIPRSTSMSF